MPNYLSVAIAKSKFQDKIQALYEDDNLDIQDDLIEYDIDEAEGEVDSYLGARYDVPITSSNEVQLNACRGWTYILFQSKAYERRNDSDVPDAIMEKVKAVRALLMKISEGKIPLAGSREPENDVASVGGLDIDEGTTYYTVSNTKGW